MAAVSSQLLKSQKKDKNGSCCSRPNPSLLQKEKPHSYGEEPAEKKILFPPHGTKKSPCVTWAAFVSYSKAKFALLLPFKSLQMNCFCRAALPDTSFRALGGEKPNVFLCRWMILGRNHLFSNNTEFPSSRAKPGVHCSTLGESMWIFFLTIFSFLVPKHPGKVSLLAGFAQLCI